VVGENTKIQKAVIEDLEGVSAWRVIEVRACREEWNRDTLGDIRILGGKGGAY